ncbi:MAG: hypothetical protein AAF849_03210 [Bacteroidota bacterium]
MDARRNNHLLYNFVKILKKDYDKFCAIHRMDKHEPENLINFIIDQDLIKQKNVTKYTVLYDYEKLMRDDSMKKTHAVLVLASKYKVSERHIWAILKKNSATS